MGAFDDAQQKQRAYDTLKGAYRTDLGRRDDQIGDDEIWSHLDGGKNYQQSNVDWALNNIRGSQEAQAYRNRTPAEQAGAVRETPSDAPNDMITPAAAPAAPPVVYDEDGVTPRRGPLGGAPAAPAPQFQPPAPVMAAPAASAPAAAAPAQSQPAITNQVTELLKKRLADLSNPLDLQSDPVYQGQVRAAQVASLRGADRQRSALAERMAAQGTLRSGGFDTGVQGILEGQRESDRGFAANLAGDRLSAREQQLVQAIQIARAVGQDEIANQLEMERLSLQQELGRGDLALRGELGRGQLDLGRSQLGLQGDLGYANLGFNYAGLQNQMNRDAILALLGGT